MIKLKKCPFCKQYPEVIEEKLWSKSGYGYKGKYNYYVACVNVECLIKPETPSYNDIYGKSKEQCIEQACKDWNKLL